MLDTNTLIKNISVFTIALNFCDESIIIDPDFSMYLYSFIEDEIRNENDKIKLIANYEIANGEIKFADDEMTEFDQKLLRRYLTDSQKTLELYDEMNKETIDKLNRLAAEFYRYILMFKSIKPFSIRQ